MKQEKIILWEEKEYQYGGSYGFIPFLMSYLHEEDRQERPCVVVVPGGGYCVVSPTEAEIVAKEFYNRGYHAFVCTYTTDITSSIPLKKQPLKDLSRAIRLIRKRAEEYCIHPGRIALCGFSAGGHLCASLCVHHADIPEENVEYESYSNRPDAGILSYPVISSGEFAHEGSFLALLGKDAGEEDKRYMSLEYHVDSQTPPCFLWHTGTDETVPVENSILFARACKAAGVPFALHIFSEGDHGLSLANEEWAEGRYGQPYTLEQALCLVDFLKQAKLPVPEPLSAFVSMMQAGEEGEASREENLFGAGRKPDKEAAGWPEMAAVWLQKLFA